MGPHSFFADPDGFLDADPDSAYKLSKKLSCEEFAVIDTHQYQQLDSCSNFSLEIRF